MRTEQLIEGLSAGAGPAPRSQAARRLLPALGIGYPLALGLVLGLMPALPLATLATATPWMKLLPAAAIGALAFAWLQRSCRPAAAVAASLRRVVGLWAVLVLLGLASLAGAPGAEWPERLLGSSWWACPLLLASVSLPTLLLLLGLGRGLPVVDARRSGAAMGLVAGCLGALAYALACPEHSPAFVALWYSAGLLLSSALGAALGPRLLRW